jgi:phosphatidylglycerol lysyltransferase
MISERFTPGWAAAVAVALVATAGLGLFAYKNVDYSSDLWWQFALDAEAPRFLRATIGALGVSLFVATARLLRHSRSEPAAATPEEMAQAERIAREGPVTYANLVLLGDKSLLLGEGGASFLMYAVEGRSWVSLGDPIGPESERTELAWRFREMADAHGGWTVFYQARPESLPIYLDLGLGLLKLGEEARVKLADFNLEGGGRSKFRQTLRKVEREGCTFEILQPADVPTHLPRLREVSDGWLAAKNTREKGFSLGRFDERYLARMPVAVVRKEDRIVAFANVLAAAAGQELSMDLMRYDDGAPPSVMEYLFLRLILWGKENGYAWFSLGMAPFSGFEDRPLSPLWNRVGSVVFRHGEHFYNFQGLREYKEKFDPVWEPRYLASPGGMAMPRILTNVASLISGGIAGVVTK